jgi:peptidyl-prolyl cis-trans isomerase B (cyclophilin B)
MKKSLIPAIILIVTVAGLVLFTRNGTTQMNDALNTNRQGSQSKESTQSATPGSNSIGNSTSQTQQNSQPLGQATPQPQSQARPEQLQGIVTVELQKGGVIKFQLDAKDAPNTSVKFARKANSGFYDNLIFHRVEDWVVQGGDPLGNGTGGGTQPTELNNMKFVVGAVGIARGGDIKISNDSQFFIVKKDSQFLNHQYTFFGLVTSGMDVVNSIQVGDKIKTVRVQ